MDGKSPDGNVTRIIVSPDCASEARDPGSNESEKPLSAEFLIPRPKVFTENLGNKTKNTIPMGNPIMNKRDIAPVALTNPSLYSGGSERILSKIAPAITMKTPNR